MNEELKKFSAEIASMLREKMAEPAAVEVTEKIKAAKDTGNFEVVVSTEDVDRHGEIVRQDGWELDRYKDNPIVLFAHDSWSMPVGLTDSIEVVVQNGKKVLRAKGHFAPAEANPFAQQVRAAYDAGILTKTSVGFIVKEQNGPEITKAELLEFSFVPIPANPYVEDQLKAAGCDLAEFKAKGLVVEATKEGEPVDNSQQPQQVTPEPEKPTTETPAPAENEAVKPNSEAEKAQTGAENGENGQKAKAAADDMPAACGAIMTDMQTKVTDAMTEAALAIQELAAGEEGDEEEGKITNPTATKEGRVLSSKNRERVTKAVGLLKETATALQDLLDESEPGDGKAQGEDQQLKTADPAEPKVEPSAEGDEVFKSLDSWLDVRRVLRVADKALNNALKNANQKIRERSGNK